MSKRSVFSLSLAAVTLLGAITGVGCKQQLAKLQDMIHVPGRCPDAIPDQATGTESPRDALGCFKKAVDEKNGDQFLRVTCRGKTAAGCKQAPGSEKEASGIVAELAKKDFGGIVAQWDESPKAHVYAVEQKGSDKRVSLITVCQIAIENRWAVCAVDEGSREAAEKREAAGNK
jgi:hypothetical protein